MKAGCIDSVSFEPSIGSLARAANFSLATSLHLRSRLTLAAIRAALQRTTATAKLQKPETTYRLCVYGKHHEYVTLFPKS
jgi:hypothetical protein